jgi:hypothetical protein
MKAIISSCDKLFFAIEETDDHDDNDDDDDDDDDDEEMELVGADSNKFVFFK